MSKSNIYLIAACICGFMCVLVFISVFHGDFFGRFLSAVIMLLTMLSIHFFGISRKAKYNNKTDDSDNDV